MHKITPHLWFDKEAVEAAELYVSIFPGSRVASVNTIHDTPAGDTDTLSFELFGHPFAAISAGPLFQFTPSISFLVACETKDEVDRYWSKLSEGGQALMDLGSYPFSERYGWTTDRYGLSWQVIFAGDRLTQRVTPTLMYVGEVVGRAEEAIGLYTSLFPNSSVGNINRYGPNEPPDKEGTIRHASFKLFAQEFAAMDSALEHNFGFNEAISLMVHCDSQDEIDQYWALSADPGAEQCGWIKDRFGVSWQIVPRVLDDLTWKGTKEQTAAVTEAFLKMKKFDIAELQKAYDSA